MDYHVAHIRDPASYNNIAACRVVHSTVAATVASTGGSLYGVFTPLFGLASNEMYAITSGTPIAPALEGTGLELVTSTLFNPTVRPTEHSPRHKPGIYVFRWFAVHTPNIDEIVRLSEEAWLLFEGGFDTEVQCLFRQPDAAPDVSTMLLITQYRDLSVWEASRAPAPAARENFQRRATLTLGATPICTRLVLP